jgi:hypothetical protein
MITPSPIVEWVTPDDAANEETVRRLRADPQALHAGEVPARKYITHRGRLLSVAFQPEQKALTHNERMGTTTVHQLVQARWVAIVIDETNGLQTHEKGRIVEINPTDLRVVG